MNAFDLLDVVLMGKRQFWIDAVVVGPLVFDKSLENKMVCVVNYWLLLKTIYKVDNFFYLVYLLCEFSWFGSSNSNNTSFQSFFVCFLVLRLVTKHLKLQRCHDMPDYIRDTELLNCFLIGISVFVFH